MHCFKVRWLPGLTPEISSGEVEASANCAGGCQAEERGGVRVIYFWRVSESQILMLTLYAKNERTDLTAAQIKQLPKIVEDLK
jgi:hypothetical protein